MSRETVRQAFKAAIATVFSGQVFTTREIDARNLREYVSVYMNSGSVERSSTAFETKSTVAVSYTKEGNTTDADLDAVADQLVAAILDSAQVKAEVRRPLYRGFEYEALKPTIHLEFDVIF